MPLSTIGVVAGRDHHAEIGAHRAGQHRHRRGRHRPDHHHVHADAGEAGDERGLHHVAGQPRVLADHHPVAMVAAQEMRARRLADPLRHRRRHRRLVGAAPDPVGAEEFARHWPIRCAVRADLAVPMSRRAIACRAARSASSPMAQAAQGGRLLPRPRCRSASRMSQPTRILLALARRARCSASPAPRAAAPGSSRRSPSPSRSAASGSNALQMTIVPLVVALLITGIAASAEAARASRLAGRAR